jgi:hypothetical protein
MSGTKPTATVRCASSFRDLLDAILGFQRKREPDLIDGLAIQQVAESSDRAAHGHTANDRILQSPVIIHESSDFEPSPSRFAKAVGHPLTQATRPDHHDTSAPPSRAPQEPRNDSGEN